MAGYAGFAYDNYWSVLPGGGLDGFFHDNVSTIFMHDEASNTPPAGWPTNLAWENAWHQFVSVWAAQIGSARGTCDILMGNIGDVSRAVAMGDVRRQWWEHFHNKYGSPPFFPLAELEAGFDAAMSRNNWVFMGTSNRAIGGADDPYWTTPAHAELTTLLARAAAQGKAEYFSLLMHCTDDCYLYHGATCAPLQ
jgi:hypothetical protein